MKRVCLHDYVKGTGVFDTIIGCFKYVDFFISPSSWQSKKRLLEPLSSVIILGPFSTAGQIDIFFFALSIEINEITIQGTG